jgi:hypothetical protein
MECRRFVVVVILGMAISCACAQSAAKDGVDAIPVVTVCDIDNNPLQFKDKLVRVRGQVLSGLGSKQFWVNQPSFGKICRFLPAKFQGPVSLGAGSAFGIFTGRVVVETTLDGSNFLVGRGTQSKVLFVIEQLSDVHGRQDQNGLVPIHWVYDSQSGWFLK